MRAEAKDPYYATKKRLTDWGAWVRTNRREGKASTVWKFGTPGASLDFSPDQIDEFMTLERCVARLDGVHEDYSDLVESHYVGCMPYHVLANRNACSVHEIRRHLHAAVVLVEVFFRGEA